MLSAETQSKLENYRRLASTGNITQEQMREVIQMLRQDRLHASAAAASSGKRASSKKPPQDTGLMLDSLLKL